MTQTKLIDSQADLKKILSRAREMLFEGACEVKFQVEGLTPEDLPKFELMVPGVRYLLIDSFFRQATYLVVSRAL